MYLLNTRKQKVQLARLDTEVLVDPVTRGLAVSVSTRRSRDPVNTSALVTRASRAFFEIGGLPGVGVPAPPPEGPPPVVFRESSTGLLHVVYREVVIRFRHGTSEKKRRDILKSDGFHVRRTNPFIPDQVVVYDPQRKHTGEDLVEVANRWSEMDEVVFASPNFVSQFRRHEPPSILQAEWHLRNQGVGGAKRDEDVNVLAAWKKTTGNRKIVVAILDDGVDVGHPNLKPNIRKNPDTNAKDQVGRDFFLPDDDPDHFNPRPKKFQFPFDQMQGNDIHGTCCAGIVAAAGVSGGAVGIAPGCRILPVKVFHADDLAQGERVADAIRYAAIHADILSCSWSSGINPDIEQAIEDAGQLGRKGRGAAVFCAAGNNFHSQVGFPARDPNAIAIGASTDQAALADYSNVGPEIALVAPSSGGTQDIFTTDVSIPNRGFNTGKKEQGGEDGLHTNRFGGTSAATPLAAGAAALVLSVHPSLSRADLLEVLKKTVDKIGSGYDAQGHSNEFGFGRINVGKAVEEALGIAESLP
jgi:subtilisin family serine protease